MKIVSMAAAAALTLLLLLAAACGSPKAPQSSTPPSSEESSSSLPPESLEYDQEHDHSGLPGLELPESLPVGDYAFEAYDSSEVQVGSTSITIDGETVDAIILTVPRDTKNFLESYADGVAASLTRLDEGPGGDYTAVPLGNLTGDDQWAPEGGSMKAGHRYDITFGEPGLFRLDITDSSGATDTYYFSVSLV